MVLNAFKSGIFPLPHQLKVQALILMLQRLPITLAQVEAGNTSENLLIKICQIRYSL